MDPTLSALLRACKDEPFDDAPRLVLADWLDDHGDSDRAEFVRLQVALGGLWGDEPDSVEPECRRDLLLRRNRERWFGPAEQWYHAVRARRGLIEIEATAAQLREHPPEDLPEVLGWIESLTIANPEDGVPALGGLLDSPILGHFSRINLSGSYRTDAIDRFGDASASQLACNPHLRHVRSLSLRYNQLTAIGVSVLARCERLAGLRELDLGSSWINDGAARALAQAVWLGDLVRLSLETTTRLGSAGLAAVLGSPRLGNLTHLNLDDADLDETAARALAESPRLASLEALSLDSAESSPKAMRLLANSPHLRPRTLELDYVEFGDAGARILASGKLLDRIKALHLSGNALTAAGATTLLKSKRLAGLEFLRLWDPVGDAACEVIASADHFAELRQFSTHTSQVGPAGAAALGRSRVLDNLVMLGLNHSKLGGQGIRDLAEGPGLPALEALYLSETRPLMRGVQALVSSGRAARLKRLDLSNNALGDTAARALARLKEGARLTELDLADNRIGPEGVKALASSPGLSRLRSLILCRNRIGTAGVQSLIRSTRLPQLVSLNVAQNGLTFAGGEALRDWPRRADMVSLYAEDPELPQKLRDEIRVRS